MSNHDPFVRDPVLHPVVPDASNMSGLGSSGHATVLLELDGALSILFEDIFLYLVSLCLHEVLYPDGARKVVICTDKVSFGGALCVKFWFVGLAQYSPAQTTLHRQCGSSCPGVWHMMRRPKFENVQVCRLPRYTRGPSSDVL